MITGPFAPCENWKSVSWKEACLRRGGASLLGEGASHLPESWPCPRGTGRHPEKRWSPAGALELRQGQDPEVVSSPGLRQGQDPAAVSLPGLRPEGPWHLCGASAVLNRAQGSLLPVT